METREAVLSDVDSIVDLIENRRVQLERWEPNFWRKSTGSADMSRAFLSTQIEDPDTKVLIVSKPDCLVGCLQFKPTFVPPVYNPVGTSWMVDDFVVRDGDWENAGVALLKALKAMTIERLGGQLIFPVPCKDAKAAAFFEKHGLSPTTTWWTTSSHF